MGKHKYRKKAMAFMEAAKSTQTDEAEFGDFAQSQEDQLLGDDFESNALYQDMSGAGEDLGDEFTRGAGGFRTTAINKGYAGQLGLNRHSMFTSQFGDYADMGQQANENIGNMNVYQTKVRNKMRQNERGSTMRMVMSIAQGVQAGMTGGGGGPGGGGQPATSSVSTEQYAQTATGGGSSPSWMQGISSMGGK